MKDFAKVKSNESVGVVHQLYFPWHCQPYRDPDFFKQLAPQGLFDAFADLQFAARKLPVAFIDLPLGREVRRNRPSGLISTPTATSTTGRSTRFCRSKHKRQFGPNLISVKV